MGVTEADLSTWTMVGKGQCVVQAIAIMVTIFIVLQSCGRQEHWSTSEDNNDPLYSLYAMYQVILFVSVVRANLHLNLLRSCVVSANGQTALFEIGKFV